MHSIPYPVVNKAVFPKSVHEEANARPGGAYHLRQSRLAESWDGQLRNFLLAELGHEKEHSRQPSFAGIEELIDQVILVA